MKHSISIALTFLSITVITVVCVSAMNFAMAIQKANAYHYATVHEIESSDFASAVMNERMSNSDYTTSIIEKSVKEDMRIYEVKTTTTISIPIFGYSTEYAKVSVAR